jgi:hypothetical protein
MPALSGVGHIIAGLLIRPDPPWQIEASKAAEGFSQTEPIVRAAPASVTEHTTNILDRKISDGRES